MLARERSRVVSVLLSLFIYYIQLRVAIVHFICLLLSMVLLYTLVTRVTLGVVYIWLSSIILEGHLICLFLW